MSKYNKDAVGAGVQMAYEHGADYDRIMEYMCDWFAMLRDCGEPIKYDYYDLEAATCAAIKLHNEGKSYDEAEKILLNQ